MAKSARHPATRWTGTACERCNRLITVYAIPPTDPVRLKYYKVCGVCLTPAESLELMTSVVGPVNHTFTRQ